MSGKQAGAPAKRGLHLGSLLLGLLLLSTLIGVVANIGEIERFLDLTRQARPSWLAVGLVLQFGVSSLVTAAMVASLSPVPLGLGTFEATSVAMLRLLGVGLEAGLMATILLRGMTVWLPMLPGVG